MNILKKLFGRQHRGDMFMNPPLFRSGWQIGNRSGMNSTAPTAMNSLYFDNGVQDTSTVPQRKKAKPVNVYKEITGEEPKMDLSDIDDQIQIVKTRIKLLKESLGTVSFGDENAALLFLKARKKYLKNKDLFQWGITNNTLIEKLLSKYQLQAVGAEGYYRNLPGEALEQMRLFVKAFAKVRDDEPSFKLIIDQDETEKDPILLAGSPFGNWFYVLGAWDKEVEIVDKIIYKGK